MALCYGGGDEAGREGIETVCRLCQTNGAGPCGKEIIMGSVSVKHGHTIQKKRGGESVCDEEAWGVCEECGEGGSSDHRGSTRTPRLSAATLALPKNACNPPADCSDPPALRSDAAALLHCQGGWGRGASGGRGGSGGNVPFSAVAIVLKSQLHFSDLLCAPVDSGY